jgi:hypothetical protein
LPKGFNLMERSLDELGIKYNCDKSSVQRRKTGQGEVQRGHDYLRKYEFFLRQFRNREDLSLLELGIGPNWNMGASLQIWSEYFNRPDTKFKMVDINPAAKEFEVDRVRVEVGDLGNDSFLKSLAKESHDIIVDDASHFWGHQINAFKALFSSVKPGGVYVVEDIQTSFGGLRDRYSQGAEIDAFKFLTSVAAGVAGDGRSHSLLHGQIENDGGSFFRGSIDSVTFIRHSCIICKAEYY